MSTYDDASLIYYPSGYKAGTAYSLKPTDGSGDLTFTRASTATRVNSSGLIESVATGVPRIDYTGGGCGKLLLEPQRTNLALESNTLSTAPNVVDSSTTTANVYVSPDGTQNAMRFTETTANDKHGFYQYYTVTAQAYTTSIFTKQTGRRYICLSTDMTGTQVNSFFDLQTESVLTSGSGHTCSVENYGNGWLRLIVSFTASAGFHFVIWGGSPNGTTNSYAGSTSISQTFYGSQLEEGSYPTSYIPTTSTAVTRVSDSFSATGLGEYLGDSEGTLYIEAEQFDNVGFVSIIQAVNSGVTLGVTGSNTFLFNVRVAGATQADIQSGAIFTPNANFKLAGSYKTNDFKFFKDGSSLGTDISGGTFADGNLITIQSNSSFPSNQPFYGRIKQILVFPTALSDADAIALTTI